MIDMSADNTFQQLKKYTIDYHNDGITALLIPGEVIYYSYNNDDEAVKIFISDKRIIIEENKEKIQYTFIWLNTLEYLQMEVDEVSRQVSGVGFVFGLRNGQEITLIIEDEINPIAMNSMLVSRIFQ